MGLKITFSCVLTGYCLWEYTRKQTFLKPMKTTLNLGIMGLGSDIVKSEKELFDLAKQYVMLDSELQKDNLPEYELDEIKEGLEEIRNIVLEKRYNVDKFVEYQELYREMTIIEYCSFIKTL